MGEETEMNIDFKITLWETRNPTYMLEVDGKRTIEVKKGELRKILYEMEKYMRLRFKGELQHK